MKALIAQVTPHRGLMGTEAEGTARLRPEAVRVG